MGTDGIFLHFLKREIEDFAVGARVEKIYQPAKHEAVLLLRTRTEQRKLFFSASGNYPRVHFTNMAVENPMKPPMLCMLMRKHLSGAVVKSVSQIGHDRILRFDFDATNEIGDRVNRALIVEIMAQYSNIILLDENDVIIDAVKRVDETKSGVREVLPHVHYVLPPQQGKVGFERDSAEVLLQTVLNKSDKQLSSAILNSIEGISPLIAREIAYRITLGDCAVSDLNESMQARLLKELQEMQTAMTDRNVSPWYCTDEQGQIAEYSYMPLTHHHLCANGKIAESFSSLLDDYSFGKERYFRAKAKASDLYKLVETLIERTARKLVLQREELASCADKEIKRIYAELINANLYQLEKGAFFYDLPNYYDNYNMVRIPVQPHLTPSANAQRYYKEYRKAQTAEKMLTDLIEKGEAQLAYLKTVEDALSRAQTERELSEIRAELREAGFIKKTPQDKKNSKPLPPLEYISPNGFKVYVGRNNLQNDRLSLKTAAKSDWWFHAQKAPGSHVVLSVEGKEAPEADMEYAAAVAAHFSSVRSGGSVEVDYTQVRNLKKPPASAPGFVIYHVYKTMLIQPIDPEKQ